MTRSFGLGVLIAFVSCTANSTPIVGGTPFFTAVRAQIELANCSSEMDPACVVQTNLGVDLAEAGVETSAYSIVRADLGVNGAFASVSVAHDREAYAESIWSDAFVVHGGTGQSTAQITVRTDGSVDGLGRPGGPGSNAFYALFVNAAPMTCNFDDVSCTGQMAIPLTEPLSGVQYLQANIEFTYDKPFYLASYLGAEVVGGQTGMADFFHSAHLGITAPVGAVLTTASGHVYPTASAVPEPQAVLLFPVGILLAWRAGSRHTPSRPSSPTSSAH